MQVGRRDWIRTNDPHHVKVERTLCYSDQRVIVHAADAWCPLVLSGDRAAFRPYDFEMPVENPVDAFLESWRGVTASELATAQSFLMGLCDLLGVARPHPTEKQDYMFERPVTFAHGDGSTSAGRIDCYKQGHFVLEAKKVRAGAHTRGFDDALMRARAQGESYARALPASDGRPPFVMVVDVGHVIEVYSEFTRSGGTYTPFPDPRSHRITLDDLRKDAIRARLRAIIAASDYAVAKPAIHLMSRYANDVFDLGSMSERDRFAGFIAKSLHRSDLLGEVLTLKDR